MSSDPALVWDAWNTEHIKKHAVSRSEIEQVCQGKTYRKVSYKNRIVLVGKTQTGRALTIVCSQEKQEDYYVVSARDASKKERRWHHEQTKTDQTI